MSFNTDTIAAIATASGRGGVGIIRLSGPQARSIGEHICGRTLKVRQAHFCQFYDRRDDNKSDILDNGIALYFAAPYSFTGEDVVELQGHGGPVILDLLLKTCITAGARLARAGEFSERAFLNDKLDLAQVEAIADLINSSTEEAARSASRSLQGAFSHEIDSLMNQLTRLRVYVEATIDFPEEDIDFLADAQVENQLAAIEQQLNKVHSSARQGSLLQEGMKLVIAGKPNAGKSSLLNALAGQDTAIVTPIAGTTRDVLHEHIQIDGMPLHIVDTAGLRESTDEVEQEGIRRAWQEIQSADRILLVVDSQSSDIDLSGDAFWPDKVRQISQNIPVTIILNKADLSDLPENLSEHTGNTRISLSAKTGQGMTLLRKHLKQCMGFSESAASCFSARRRHLQALDKAADYLKQCRQQLNGTGADELLAEDLRYCHNSLGEITGAISSDELLGEIFSSFCIGK
ncbi:MAG: tRNA uridine-5-carboxymethylaminomethyl(34) synthesis GTPase MnmE [Parahaliea sp.]